MGGAVADPLLALFLFEVVCGTTAALVAAIAGSDLRPSEYPSAKNKAQIPTSPKNRTSNFPVPRVISVSCDEAIVQLQAILARDWLGSFWLRSLWFGCLPVALV